MADLLRAYDWTTALSVAACTVGALVVYQLWSRPVLSKDAPRILKGLPILGSLGFFKERAVFLQDGRKAGAGDHFSFYYGPHPIIATAGDIGRAVFFGTRELDFTAGYVFFFLFRLSDLDATSLKTLQELMHPLA